MARASGVEVVVDGADLVLRAAGPPPPGLLEALSRQKAEVVALLRAGLVGDWKARFDELVGGREYENSLERADTEDGAYLDLLDEWLRANSDVHRRHGVQAVFVAMGALRSVGIVPSAERRRLAQSDEEMRFDAAREVTDLSAAQAHAGAPGV